MNRKLFIIFGITLSSVMGVTSITPAFPEIIKELHISEKQVGLLITVFTLPGIFLAPVAGGLCGFTTSLQKLLILRFVQGIGGAALGSLNTTIIGDLFEGNERDQAMGLNASVLSIGAAVYPFIGGMS